MLQTDRRQTEGRRHIAKVNVSSRSLKIETSITSDQSRPNLRTKLKQRIAIRGWSTITQTKLTVRFPKPEVVLSQSWDEISH